MAEMKHTEDSSASGVCKNCNNHIREKLVELLREGIVFHYFSTCEEQADYLLANGVTIQQWIPVTERLPEDGQSVLTYKNGICDIQTYEARRNGWVSKSWFWSMATVTHWMPMPPLPKGE